MVNNYRPGPGDFHIEGQQLSLKECGKHDYEKFTILVQGERQRIRTTGWSTVCFDRHQRGISRQARIKGNRG